MKKIVCLFSLILGLQARAVDIEFTRSALDHEDLIRYNFEPGKFEEFERIFEDSLLSFFQSSKTAQEIRIIQTFDS